jgi:hypothetical protein
MIKADVVVGGAAAEVEHLAPVVEAVVLDVPARTKSAQKKKS